MNLLEKTTLRILFTVLITVALLAMVWLARKPILTFLFAMLFAYLLEPLIAVLQRWVRCNRGLAIAITYVAIFAGLLIAGLVAGPRVVSEAQHLSQAAPDLYGKVATGNIAFQVGKARGWSQESQARVQQFLAQHKEDVLATVTAQSRKVTEVAGNTLWVVLVPIVAVFFLKDKTEFGRNLESLVENEHKRELLRDVLSDLDEMMSHFVRAQLYLAAISGLVYITVLTVMRVPYSWALGTLGGLLEFIPFVGPLVAGALILGVSFALNYGHLLLVLAVLLVWRGMQDYVIAPRVLGGKVEVHPLAAIFGVLAGGEIAGVAGVYFAVPVMAAVRILWQNWRQHTAGLELEPQVRARVK